MATEKSEPRVGLILKVAVVSIATLLAVHAALVAYFDHIAQAEEIRKMGEIAPEALMNQRADEKTRLTSGPMPIDKAMQELATRGRTEIPDIAPTMSRDVAPLQGWTKMPGQVPPLMVAPAPPNSASAPQQALGAPGIDAGVVVDGGTPKTNKADRAHPDGGPSPKKSP